MKYYAKILVILAFIGLITALLWYHVDAVNDAKEAGIKEADLRWSQHQIDIVEATKKHANEVYQHDKKIYKEALESERKQNKEHLARYKRLNRYATELQKTNSQCNRTIGYVQLLNDEISQCTERPTNRTEISADTGRFTTVTGETFGEWGLTCAKMYCDVKNQAITLIKLAEKRQRENTNKQK